MTDKDSRKLTCLDCGYNKGDGQELAVYVEPQKIMLQCPKCGSFKIKRDK